METTLTEAGEQSLRAIVTKGLNGEAFLVHSRELSIEVNSGAVETLKQATQTGVGIRVFDGKRMGFAYTTQLQKSAIDRLVSEASRMAAFSSPDDYYGLPDGRQIYQTMEIADCSIHTVPLEAKIELACEAERIARGCHPSIKVVDRAGYQEHERTILVVNNYHLHAYAQANYCGLHVSLAAVNDDETQSGFAYTLQRGINSLDPEMVGVEAANRALRGLNARAIASGPLPCIIDSQMVTRFLGLLAPSLQADMVQKGKSMLAGKTGEIVFSPCLQLMDDATCEAGMAGFPFDGEGVASQKHQVVDQGVLLGFLYDTYTAKREGGRSTGNAVRSFRGLPTVGSTNLMIAPGSKSAEALRDGIVKGLYVTELMGMHTANPITGEFSLGAAGIMIERGELTYPVRGITIAGNLLTMLREVDAVGSDWQIYGSKAAPSLRCKSLNIAGK